MKRILFFVQLPPPIHGVSLLNKILIESSILNEKFEIDVLEIRFSNNLNELKKIRFSKFIRLIILWIKLIVRILKFKPNLIYFTIVPTGKGFYRDIIFVLVMRIFRVKILYHLHGNGISEKTKRVIIRIIYKIVFFRQNVICSSIGLYEKEIKPLEISKLNFFIVPNGTERVEKDIYLEMLEPKVIRILFFSNVLRAKGIFIALESIKRLYKLFSDFEFIIGGGVSSEIEEREIERFIEENSLRNLVRRGSVVNSEFRNYLFANSDIFLFPTLNETFGIVNIEAMKFGLPIISSNEGAIPEVVIDGLCGFIVDKGDVEKIVEKLMFLITNPELRKTMSKNCLKRFEENYTLEKFEQNVKDAIFNCIK